MTREEAIKVAESKWWEQNMFNEYNIVGFQLFEERSVMPFDKFQMALEKVFMEPIFTHQLGNETFVNSLKERFEKQHDSKMMKKVVLQYVNNYYQNTFI